MILIIKIILFWISIAGYFIYTHQKLKIKQEFILPIIFTSIAILMFFSGILNFMKYMAIIIFLGGCFLLIYKFIKKKITKEYIKSIFKISLILTIVLIIYFTIISINMNLLHYDNFSHWALIVKQMFLKDSLPNFETIIVSFRSYPPGSACFLYYFGELVGKFEVSMIMAQCYLSIILFSTLFVFIDNKRKILTSIMLVNLFLFMAIANIAFSDLLVDSLLSFIVIACLTIAVYYHNDLKKVFFLLIPFSIFLVLVKNVGLVFVGLNGCMLLYLGFKNKKFKESIKYFILLILIVGAILFLWQRHLLYVYPQNTGLTSKHSMSISNFSSSLHEKGLENIIKISKIYLRHFFDIEGNIINYFIIGINSLLILFLTIFQKFRKEIFRTLILSDLVYLGYFLILGLLYIISMPYSEALRLASYDRYMFTIIFVIIGGLYIQFFDICNKTKINKKCKYDSITIMGIFIIILTICLIFNNKLNPPKMLLGKQDYNNSVVQNVDNIIKDNNELNEALTHSYVVYAPASINDSGYLKYLLYYKLNTLNIKIVYNLKELETIYIKGKEYLIIMNNDKDVIKFVKNNKLNKVSLNLYK